MEEDEATINLMNMIQFQHIVQAGEYEATIHLVTKLDAEAKAEEAQYNQEKDKRFKDKTNKS